MHKLALAALTVSVAALPAFGQDVVKATIIKHLETSKAFTVKVAEAMPEANYDFKLTPPQMSFAQQMTHLAQGLTYFSSQFDQTIALVSNLTHDQIAKTYKGEGGEGTGLDLLLGMLDHTTHHRASAEMYLRVKGITPPEYQF